MLLLPALADDAPKKTLDSLFHQLFKKHQPGYFQGLCYHPKAFRLTDLPLSRYQLIAHPGKLPPAIGKGALADFTGREHDLAALSKQLLSLEDSARVLTVKGSGGIGKTTLVKKLAIELAARGHYAAGITFIDCEPLVDAEALERQLAAAFGLQQADQLLAHLDQYHDQQSRLIILDNFESQLHLPSSEACKTLAGQIAEYAAVLITSRELLTLDGETHYPLRALTSDEALALFNRFSDHRFSRPEQQTFLRRELLEPLLDNNPLAIKLICGGLPPGKDLTVLKQELESDYFNKISKHDLELFAHPGDDNINRQDSLYGSVLYSWRALSETEQKAFERLSLFPDGIDLTAFQRLSQSNNQSPRGKNTDKKPISDREIKALADKSLLDSREGRIKLQSIINRFATRQFQQRNDQDNQHAYYQTAFGHNAALMEMIENLDHTEPNQARQLFMDNFNNLLAAMDYGAAIVGPRLAMDDYLLFISRITNTASATSSSAAVARQLDKVIALFSPQEKEINPQQLLALRVLQLYSRYFAGEFSRAYGQLQQLMPLSRLQQLGYNNRAEWAIHTCAMDIYVMEGESLKQLELHIKHHRHGYTGYPYALAQLGLVYPELLDQLQSLAQPDLHAFEALIVAGQLPAATITAKLELAINALHKTAHRQRVELSYLRARLSPLSLVAIDPLVSVNPFTRGLKSLMRAFALEQSLTATPDPFLNSSQDADEQVQLRLGSEIIGHYQQALPALEHIKFYWMQGHYYFARFLLHFQPLSEPCPDPQTIYQQGLELTIKHHYRYWQHQFKLLKNPQLGDFCPADYPLPGNPDPTGLVNGQIKWLKQLKKPARG